MVHQSVEIAVPFSRLDLIAVAEQFQEYLTSLEDFFARLGEIIANAVATALNQALAEFRGRQLDAYASRFYGSEGGFKTV